MLNYNEKDNISKELLDQLFRFSKSNNYEAAAKIILENNINLAFLSTRTLRLSRFDFALIGQACIDILKK